MTFYQVLMHCAAIPELVAEFDRLTGANLSRRGAVINLMIDDASGKTNDDLGQFVDFVWECVWLRMVGGEAA